MSWQAADIKARLPSVIIIWLLMLGGMLVLTLLVGNARLAQQVSTSAWVVQHEDQIQAITDFSMYPFYLLFIAILAAGWLRRDACLRALGWAYITAQLIGTVAIVRVLKMATGHARPLVQDPGLVDTWIGPTTVSAFHSFPSGHTADLFTSAIFMAVLVPQLWLRVVLLAFALSVGTTRVALSMHYPVDVLAGASLGGLVAILVLRYWMNIAAAASGAGRTSTARNLAR